MDKIEFIIPTYERTEHLMTIISSIVCQTNPNWLIHVVIDRPYNEDTIAKIQNIAIYYEYEDRIKFTLLDEHFGDWGHTPRNYGVSKSISEWVVMTGEDNYYAPVFVDEMLKVVDDETHFVYCDMVLNGKDNVYLPVPTRLEFGFIDIGCFMTRTDKAKQLPLLTHMPEADWIYSRVYVDTFTDGKIKKVDKVMYVHN